MNIEVGIRSNSEVTEFGEVSPKQQNLLMLLARSSAPESPNLQPFRFFYPKHWCISNSFSDFRSERKITRYPWGYRVIQRCTKCGGFGICDSLLVNWIRAQDKFSSYGFYLEAP